MSFLLFLVSGGLSTLLDLGLFALLIQVLDGSLAFALSYLICIVARFAFDVRFTFGVDSPELRHFRQYLAASLCLMLMGLGVFHLLELFFSPVVAKVLSIPPVTLTGFLVMHYLVFPSPEASRE